MQVINALTLSLIPYTITERYEFQYLLQDVHSGTRYSATVQASEKTWVEGLLVLTLPIAARGHRTAMQRVGDSLYDQFYREGAFSSDARQKVVLDALEVERLDDLGRRMVLEPPEGERLVPATPSD